MTLKQFTTTMRGPLLYSAATNLTLGDPLDLLKLPLLYDPDLLPPYPFCDMAGVRGNGCGRNEVQSCRIQGLPGGHGSGNTSGFGE